MVCPVLALIRRCLHLRQHHSPPTTSLCTLFLHPTLPTPITPAMLTTHLRRSATILFPTLGFNPTNVSARSLRAGGAMALLCAQVDTDVIKLIGRWRSDEMLRYLHLQAYPQMRNMAPLMAQGGNFHATMLRRPVFLLLIWLYNSKKKNSLDGHTHPTLYHFLWPSWGDTFKEVWVVPIYFK